MAAGLRALTQRHTPARPIPSVSSIGSEMSPADIRHSAGLMRVNHTGEVCAQALYVSQGLTTRNAQLNHVFQQAADEENDHLAWCYSRLQDLNSHSSYLNPLWFTGAFCIGAIAGLLGDEWNLGFLAQTEEQVSAHLGHHLQILPATDLKSRAIVTQMQIDETEHAHMAVYYGAKTLPYPVQIGMKYMAKVMTTVAYYV